MEVQKGVPQKENSLPKSTSMIVGGSVVGKVFLMGPKEPQRVQEPKATESQARRWVTGRKLLRAMAESAREGLPSVCHFEMAPLACTP